MTLASCSQHNRAIDLGTYHKVVVHGPDMSGKYEHGTRAGEQRQNHRGKYEPAAWHAFTSSAEEGKDVYGTDGATAWFQKGDKEFDSSAFDTDYLTQTQSGHRQTGDCAVRQQLTQHFADLGMKRPKPKHWA